MNYRHAIVTVLGMAVALALYVAPRPPGKWHEVLTDPALWGISVGAPAYADSTDHVARAVSMDPVADSAPRRARAPRVELVAQLQGRAHPALGAHSTGPVTPGP